MEFPDQVIVDAWIRAKGRCECKRESHNHPLPHDQELSWNCHGQIVKSGWDAYHKDEDPTNNTLENCEILCMDCVRHTIDFNKAFIR